MATPQPAAGGRLAAWAVHAFTATGVVISLLAIAAVERGNLREALLWLLAALVIDGMDGALARGLHVAERLPRIDGAALDLIIDYLNYVLVPALLILKGEFLPQGLAVPLCAAILVSSLYVFVRRDMKTDDGYFRGFPALWNLVAFYFVLVSLGPWIAAGIVAALVVLTFAPVHVVHPFRADDSKVLAPVAATVWAASTLIVAVDALGDRGSGLALGISLGSLLVLTGIGLLRTARGSEP